DKDTRTEIVVNSNPNCNVVCPDLDPIHPGVRCLDNSDCFSKQCDSGFCRCSTNADCGELSPDAPGGLKCVAPLGGTPGNGNVCRMQHPGAQVDPESAYVGVRVLRDRLDRWADSRPLWNQHAYSITNINDDGTVPASSQWKQNFLQPGLNNFRANVQGPGSVSMPDITGALNKDEICRLSGGTVTLNARVCNRGFRVVGADMPATFYLGPVTDNNILCVSYTNGPVPVGDACLPVSCQVNGSVPVGSTVTMVVNDDGQGHATTVECNSNNNTDSILIEQCPVIQ
ncbi:MAG TPA: hypothetical protein VGJ84_03155, partial [Polyangiaceae bacterium]